MFEGLKWREAAKRAAIFTGIWLALVYVINTISPGSFGMGGEGGLLVVGIYAAVFFVLYALVFAFIERRKERARAAARRKETPERRPTTEGESSLKGQRNPNTSRKKATRRRR